MPTEKEAIQSGILFFKNKNTGATERIATTAALQVGLPNKPVDIELMGKISIVPAVLSAEGGKSYQVSNDTSNLNVNSSGIGAVTLLLPSNPRNGHLLFIKDSSGTAATNNLVVTGDTSHLIDGSTTKSLTANYGFLQLVWNGSSWCSVSQNLSGGAGAQGAQGATGLAGIAGAQGATGAQGAGFNTVSSPADNRLLTSDGTSNSAVAEANLTFDGNVLRASGGTSLLTDAELGNVAIGSHPAFESSTPTAYAMFGHKDLNHSVDGNYALVQNSSGDTFLGAASGRSVYVKNGASTLGTISGFFTTLSGSAFATLTGNVTSINGNNSLNLYAGSGGVVISGSNQTVTITGSLASTSDAHIGDAEIGSLPGFAGQYAMFGHKDLNHAFGNYAIVQKNDGDVYLNASQDKYIYFTSEGNPTTNGYIGFNTSFDKTLINLQGRSSKPVAVSIGNSTSNSNVTIEAGTGNITLDSNSDVVLDPAQNYYTYFKGAGDQLGYIGFSSFFSKTLVGLQGRSGYPTAVAIGNNASTSNTDIYAGSGGITLSGSASFTTITGSTLTSTEAVIGMAAIGELPFTRTTVPNGYALFGHKTLDNSVNGNYALVQSYDGYTYLNSPTTITFQYAGSSLGGGTIGILDNDTVSFTGLAGTATTATIGNTAGASSTTINAGTGNIDIGTSATARTINIGPTGAANVTFAVNIGTSTGGGTAGSPRTINIGDYGAGYSAVNIEADYVNVANNAAAALGFYGASPKTKFTVTGSRGGNAALLAVLDVLERLGLITDSST